MLHTLQIALEIIALLALSWAIVLMFLSLLKDGDVPEWVD
jgi:hypothetical protein